MSLGCSAGVVTPVVPAGPALVYTPTVGGLHAIKSGKSNHFIEEEAIK